MLKVYRTIEGTNFREFGREKPEEIANVFFV
jgi:hypothetical protein